MSLKEEVYQAVHDYIEQRIEQVQACDGHMGAQELNGRLLELLHIQHLIYKMFADYNQKLAQQGYEEFIKPVRIDTNISIKGKQS